MLDFFLIILFALFGIVLGTIAGLLPGIHPNTMAFIILSLAPTIIASLSFLRDYGVSDDFLISLLCVVIIACAVSNVFISYIPSTFLGAPDEATSLSLLPAHHLLLNGKGYHAVLLSAFGCASAFILCFLTVLPFKAILTAPGVYVAIRSMTAYILIAISAILITTEVSKNADYKANGKRIFIALAIFFLSGIFGLVVLDMNLRSPFGESLSLPNAVLFPVFTGLFGLSTLLLSLSHVQKPLQQELSQQTFDQKDSFCSVAVGTFIGGLMGFLPGVGPAQGTVLANITRKNVEKEQTIVTLAAVNASATFFSLITLFLFLRTRTGAMVAIYSLSPIETWDGIIPDNLLSALLIAVLIATVLSFFIALSVGKMFAKFFSALPYRNITLAIIGFIIILVAVFTGLLGLFILAVSTALGLLAPSFGVKRSHAMGVLLLPVIIYLI